VREMILQTSIKAIPRNSFCLHFFVVLPFSSRTQ
jgi:hypothetical protein